MFIVETIALFHYVTVTVSQCAMLAHVVKVSLHVAGTCSERKIKTTDSKLSEKRSKSSSPQRSAGTFKELLKVPVRISTDSV